MNINENYTYYHPIDVRFADLDPLAHVNNAVYLTYLESARFDYYQRAGIWSPDHAMQTGMVVAHIDMDYLVPILFGQAIRVGLRVTRLGNKSFTMAFLIETAPEHTPLARGTCVVVTYDPQTGKSIPLPDDWREKITQFEEQNGEL